MQIAWEGRLEALPDVDDVLPQGAGSRAVIAAFRA